MQSFSDRLKKKLDFKMVEAFRQTVRPVDAFESKLLHYPELIYGLNLEMADWISPEAEPRTRFLTADKQKKSVNDDNSLQTKSDVVSFFCIMGLVQEMIALMKH
jgi:hypothetical protein